MITLDIETTGLDPTTDYVVAIGILDDFGIQILSSPVTGYQADLNAAEHGILKQFADYLVHLVPDGDFFLTYNGVEFDMPFLFSRMGIHGFTGESKILFELKDIDLIHYAKYVTGRRLGKNDACSKLGNLYVPRKSEGLWSARIYKNPKLLTENDHLEMLQHNATDLSSTARLYNVVKGFPDFTEWRMNEFSNEVCLDGNK